MRKRIFTCFVALLESCYTRRNLSKLIANRQHQKINERLMYVRAWSAHIGDTSGCETFQFPIVYFSCFIKCCLVSQIHCQ